MGNIGGRPATITTDDIVRVGRGLGMRDLSLSAVAAELGVSGAALYRHVDGRWGLERLVGEAVLADLVLVDDAAHGLEQHLVAFGVQLHDFVVANPGVGGYLQQLFPRGESGRALLLAEVSALVRRGYATDAAFGLANVVAGVAIGLAVGEERKTAGSLPQGWQEQADSVLADVGEDATVGPAHAAVEGIDSRTAVALSLAALATGLVSAAPPGRPLAQILDTLARTAGLVAS